MKIFKNSNVKKIAKAKNKAFLAIISISFLAFLLWSAAFREFVSNHPGLIGVLVAVSGEVYFDWKEETGRHSKWKKFFMALLVVSLAYELYEASESDKKAAESIRLAGVANDKAAESYMEAKSAETNAAISNERAAQANLQLAALSNNTVRLAIELEESKSNNLELAAALTEQIRDTAKIANETRDFVNEPATTERLNRANEAVTAASKLTADVSGLLTSNGFSEISQLKPKPLKQRLIDCLISIDPQIIKRLPIYDRSVPMHVETGVEQFTLAELEKLSQEPGARDLIVVRRAGGTAFMSDGSTMVGASLYINPDLLK